MSVYSVSYDLIKQRDYQKLYDALEPFDHVHALESLWYVSSDQPAKEIRDYLKKFMDSDDSIIVHKVVPAAYAVYAPKTVRDWLKAHS